MLAEIPGYVGDCFDCFRCWNLGWNARLQLRHTTSSRCALQTVCGRGSLTWLSAKTRGEKGAVVADSRHAVARAQSHFRNCYC